MYITLIDASHIDKPRVRATCSEIITSPTGILILDARATDEAIHDSHSVPSCHDLINLMTNRQNEVRLSHDWIVKAYD